MNLIKLFDKPGIIAVVGNVNEAKSNLLYHLITELNKIGEYTLYTYGLRNDLKNSIKIYSVEELEEIKNSIIILDEVINLWDLENRKAKRGIEKTIRLIFHNNNILILCGVPENFKKFISGKINIFFFKKVTLADLINGCKVKNIVMNYRGNELGSGVLNLDKDETLLFDGKHYYKLKVPYYKEYDTKLNNKQIIKNVPNNVPEKV